MNRWVRVGLVVMGAAALAWAAGLWSGARWATGLWPVVAGYGASPLGLVFATSVLASIGTSPLWIAATREPRAIAGGAIDIGVIAGGGALAAAVAGRWGMAALAAGVAGVGALIASRAHRLPWRDRRPIPRLVRLAFAAFVLILLVEAAALLAGLPGAFPWRLSRGNEVLYALVFAGAACFFLYALREPVWGAAGSLLAGFLAYDLVLIGPLLGHWDAVEPARRAALLVYILAVSASGLLAAWTLFGHPATRIGRPAAPALPPAAPAR